MNKKQVEELMRHHLRQAFPLFEETHKVNVSPLNSGNICIGYRTSAETLGRLHGTTHFDIELIRDTCYILWIELEKDKRGRGDGWKLYKTIHQFARDLKFAKARQTPSGWVIYDRKRRETRREYLLRRGYVPCGELEVEFILGS